MSSGRCAIGVDLGGTKIATAVVDATGNVLAESRVATGAREGPEAVISRIADGIEMVQREIGGTTRSVEAIGVGVPGQIDRDRRVVLSAPNLTGWDGFPVTERLSERLEGRPVVLENDANLAALGEHAFGAGRGVDDLILLTVGTGVGGGLIADGRIWRGSHGWAGELGHVILDPEGPVCGMGHRGCLESLASGTAIARQAKQRLAAGAPSRIRELSADDPEQVSAEIVGQAAREGDELGREILAAAGHTLGRGIASLVLAFDPALVVIGGSVAKAAGLLLGPLEDTARGLLFPAAARVLEIVPTRLEGRAGVLGAAVLAARWPE